MIESVFGRADDVPPSGFYGRAVAFDSRRARVEWDGRHDAQGTVRAEVKQSALDELGLAGSVELLGRLQGAGFRASRVDVWLDDLERRVTPKRVRRAVLGGQAVTHARPGRYWRDDADGRETYYLGQPSSDRRARCYDKPDPDRARFELQARRDPAAWIAWNLPRVDPGRRAEVALSHVVAFVDFRREKVKGDRSRSPRLPWWHAVVGDVERAEAVPSRPRPTIEELAAWFEKTWGRKLAEMYDELGEAWLQALLRRGELRVVEGGSRWAVA